MTREQLVLLLDYIDAIVITPTHPDIGSTLARLYATVKPGCEVRHQTPENTETKDEYDKRKITQQQEKES